MSESRDTPAVRCWGEFLFSRVIVIVVARENYGDMPAYFDGVARLASEGSPYGQDGFGYPALAFFFVAIPWVFEAKTFSLYYPAYRALCFLFDALLFFLLSRRCDRTALLLYIVSTAILANLLYHRLDIVLGCLVVGAVVLESRRGWNLSGFILGASIAFKIIPVLLVPAWLASALHRSVKDAFAVLGSVAVGGGAPMAIAVGLWGSAALFFMGDHAERGVQIESTWATIQIGLMNFGLEGKTYFGTGSYNLETPLEGVVTQASHVLAAGASIWGAVLAFRLARRGAPLVLAVSATLGTSIAASKVFSPQFLLFFLPTLALSLTSMSLATRKLAISLTLLCCMLTTWVYPYHEEELVELSAVATVPLLCRNALFVVLVVLLQVHAWRQGRRAEDAVKKEPIS